jgi:hypothetical protein
VVNEQRGTEEYVHLKSLEDEYEYMESNMPKKSTEADPAADAKEAAGDGEPPFNPDDHNNRHMHRDDDDDQRYATMDSKPENDDDDIPDHWHKADGPESVPLQRATSPSDQRSKSKYEWGLPRFSMEGVSDDFKHGGYDQYNSEGPNSHDASVLAAKEAPSSAESKASLDEDDAAVREDLDRHEEYLRRQRERLFAPKSPIPDNPPGKVERSESAKSSERWENDDID